MNHSARRLQQIGGMAHVKTYLEIGVENGVTFNSLSFEQKTAVDPAFGFDTTSFTREGVSFFEECSDDFFSKLRPRFKYDLVFIDGLHTFDQAYRDFCNSLIHSKRKTIIMLDDTIPCDRFSAMRDASQCVQERSKADPLERSPDLLAWHGDTYKVLVFIKLFHPYLDYATIGGADNPQTVVWNSQALSRKMVNQYSPPYSLSLQGPALIQAASCLNDCDYEWFCANRRELLQECQESDLMSFLGMMLDQES